MDMRYVLYILSGNSGSFGQKAFHRLRRNSNVEGQTYLNKENAFCTGQRHTLRVQLSGEYSMTGGGEKMLNQNDREFTINEGEYTAVEMTADELREQKLVGRELRRLRTSLGLSETDMAARMGSEYTGEFVARYESGKIPMEIGPFFAMLRVLQVNPSEITPKALTARHLSEKYREMDAESRDLLERLAEKLLTAQHGTPQT